MTNAKEIIENTFIEVMESMGFDEVLPIEKVPPCQTPFYIELKVTMPYMGNFIVAFSKELANEIVQNFFADSDSAAKEEYIRDCLSEFVNVFVGKVMQQLYPDLSFRIGIPEVIKKIPNENFAIHSFVDPLNRAAVVYSCLEK